MPFAVILPLEEPEADKLDEALEATDSLLSRMHALPHVSLAVFEEVDIGKLVSVVETFAASTPPFSLRFGSLGLFPGEENVVFLAAIVTKELLALHEKLHSALSDAGIESDPDYRPGSWVPHCTITMEEPLRKSLRTIASLHRRDLLTEYCVSRVEAAEFRPTATLAGFELTGSPAEPRACGNGL